MNRFLLYLFFQFSLIFFASGQEGNSFVISNRDTVKMLEAIDAAATLEIIEPDSCILLMAPLLQSSRNIVFDRGIASALVHLGMAYMAKGETNQSLASYMEAMRYIRRFYYDERLVALLYTGIGTPYLKKGDYAQASIYYYQALKEVTDNGLQSSDVACRLYLNISNLWVALVRYDYAMNYILQSEKNAILRRDTVSLISIYGNLSSLYYYRNDRKRSDMYLLKALDFAEKKRVIRAQQILLTNIGTSLRQDKRSAESIPYFEKAIALADDDKAYKHNLPSYYNIAFAYYEIGNYKKAKQYAFSTFQKSEKLGTVKETMGETMQVLAGIYQNEKNYKEANKWLIRYAAFVENILARSADSSINKLEDNYRISEKDKQIAQKQLLLSKKELELKNKNTWIGGVTGGIVLLCMLLFIVVRIGRHKQHMQAMQIRNLKQEKALGYLKAIMDGEEKERARLARELHDGIGGMLASAKMYLGAIKETQAVMANTEKLDEVIRLLNETASEVRQTAHNLIPDALIRNSLKDALLLYCSNINTGGQLDIDIQFHGQLEEMNKSVELILYRIAQELIQNIIKHSHAKHAVIQIIQDKGRLNLIVEDDGIGFDQGEIDKGFGLQNLQFRVQALQGYISVTSPDGKGTSVYIEFDLEKLKNA